MAEGRELGRGRDAGADRVVQGHQGGGVRSGREGAVIGVGRMEYEGRRRDEAAAAVVEATERGRSVGVGLPVLQVGTGDVDLPVPVHRHDESQGHQQSVLELRGAVVRR